MIVDDQIYLAVVYHNPSDYPGMYVGRYHKIRAANIIIDPEPFAVAPTLEQVREAIAPGNTQRFARWEADDPCIVEIWI